MIQKYNKFFLFLCGLFFHHFLVQSMEQTITLSMLPKEIQNRIWAYCDIQSIGRLGSASKSYNDWYQDIMFCKPDVEKCTSMACILFAKNNDDAFYACTDCLCVYAKRYKENPNDKDKQRFEHLLKHHIKDRIEIKDKINKRESERDIKPCSNDLALYSGNYLDCKQTRIFTNIIGEYLGDCDFSIFSGNNRTVLTRMLFRECICYISANILLVDLTARCKNMQVIWALMNCVPYDHLLPYLMDQLIVNNNYEAIVPLVEAYAEKAIRQAVDAAIRQKKDMLFIMSMLKDKEISQKMKFDFFKFALHNKYQALEILSLLFLDNINVVDDKGNSLLYHAVYYNNKDCVQFLLKKDINVHTKNKTGAVAINIIDLKKRLSNCDPDSKYIYIDGKSLVGVSHYNQNKEFIKIINDHQKGKWLDEQMWNYLKCVGLGIFIGFFALLALIIDELLLILEFHR